MKLAYKVALLCLLPVLALSLQTCWHIAAVGGMGSAHALEAFLAGAALALLSAGAATLIAKELFACRRNCKALIENAERFDQLAAMSRGFIWETDADGLYTYANKAIEDILGYKREELVGHMHMYDRHPAEDREKRRQEFLDLFKAGRCVYGHTRFAISKKGETLRMSSNAQQIIDGKGNVKGYRGIDYDITEKQRSYDMLQKSEERYRDLANILQNGVWQLDSSGSVAYANPRMLELLDAINPSEVVGRNRNEFMSEDVNIVSVEKQAGKDQIKTTYEAELLGVRKTRRQVMVSLLSVFCEKGIDYVVESVTDITPLKESQRKAEEMKLQILNADKMASLGVLAAGVAHEINNPNNFIMLNIGTIGKAWQDIKPVLEERYSADPDFYVMGVPYPEAKPRLDVLYRSIRDGSERIKNIVSALKDYAKQEPERQMTTGDINCIVASAVMILRSTIRKRTVNFTVDYAKPDPATLCAPHRIEQVVINLIQNACDSLKDVSKAVKVSTGQIEAENCVFIKVEDEGEGIDPENMKRLTDPFFTTKRGCGGTGLGLSVSNSIVTEHGGVLEFKSVPGKGTVATVKLPLKEGGEGR